MSILRKYARPKSSDPKKCTLSVRIPENLYKDFKAECERNGYSMAEGIRLLLELDLRGDPDPVSTNQDPPKKDVYTSAHTSKEPVDTSVYTKEKTTPPRRRSGGGGRFTYAPYVVKGKAPCPICRTWISRGNLARHMDQHDTNTEEAYKANMEKVRAMVATARGES